MKKLEKSVPVIRFKGFSEAWEQRELSSLLSFSNGINAPKEHYGKGRKMISVMDILDEKPVKYEFIRNSVQVDKKIESKNKVEYGDIVFVRSSEVPEEVGWAKAYLEKEYALYSGFSIRGKKINEFNPYFVELTLNSINRKQIERKAGGSTRFNVSQTILSSIELLMPEIEEQNKIDKFFIQLDTTIALHQRKLDTLKRMKKGFLQQMFPNNEEKVPRLRFADFDEEWEQRMLNEIANRYDNLRVPITASARSSGTTPYYGANGIQDYVEGFTHDGEFILVAEDGANDVKNYPVQYVNGKIWVNNHAHVLQAKENKHDNKFLMNAIKILKIEPFLVGGGRAKLNSDVMMTLMVKFPCYEGQKKIGTFLQRLDNTITLHKNKINKLSSLKKTYLQNMFI
ncbi:restriction endonuclease subunit S [Listeria monocytogenes]|uniref:restriction endonuclease subunit S n=5 Tax=Listeria monocytogenes TaxID=1639 RepID=UPI000436878E|nr:restriction endonuclease subunit S [Listeria monocytogenes]EAG6254885.1 restriction endonuclease subunit S [Listeria monocytogenes CFSAN003807]AHF37219.1 type I restriction enzyme, S subunit [Listeria monocytogenes serotype 1/2a str. 10-0815]AHF43151.1 type I restriction enzyme, S subunit [Listeria monocytogenes serotype 1/2a str. 88-0478]AIL67680.1 restriction endonuclease subunit S [Listeria monocytogenes]APV02380.1 restriction endonuclease subunit S [Listeria monocytogenes]